jgi:hypothetical protein
MTVKPSTAVYVRAIAFIMLIAMFHYVAGYRLMYSLGILYSKEEAKECMVEKSNIQKLTLSASDYNSLKWTEDNKEFSYNNGMYDVISIQKSGDSFIIKVFADDKETGWVSALHSYEKDFFHPDQSTKGAKSAEDVMSSFQKDCTPASGFKITVFASGLSKPSVACISGHSLQVSDNIWHPPTC